MDSPYIKSNPSGLKFNHIELGTITHGPTRKLIVSLVDYVSTNGKKQYHCDFRWHTWLSQKKEFVFSKKGLTFKAPVLRETIELLESLPEHPKLASDGTDFFEYGKVKKDQYAEYIFSTCVITGVVNLAVAEFVTELRGHTGLTGKCIEFDYILIPQIIELLKKCYNALLDKQHTI